MVSEVFQLKNRKGVGMVAEVSSNVAAPRANVLIHHGYGGSILSPVIQRLKTIFLDAGARTIIPDTTNSINSAGGSIQDITMDGHADDLADVFSWMKKQERVSSAPLHLVGYSLGGFSATRLIAREGKHFNSLLLVDPVLSGKLFWEGLEAGQPGIMALWSREGYLEPVTDRGKKFKAPYSAWEGWLKSDALESGLADFKAPVSVIIPDAMPLMLPPHEKLASRAFAQARMNVIHIPGEGHGFTEVPGSLERNVPVMF